MTVCAPGGKKLYVGTTTTHPLTFLTHDGDLADPTSIEVTVAYPDGTTDDWSTPHATITQDGTGLWRFTFPAPHTQAGTYWLYVEASGGGTDTSSERQFKVHGVHVPTP
jgi:hypothetical protein